MDRATPDPMPDPIPIGRTTKLHDCSITSAATVSPIEHAERVFVHAARAFARHVTTGRLLTELAENREGKLSRPPSAYAELAEDFLTTYRALAEAEAAEYRAIEARLRDQGGYPR